MEAAKQFCENYNSKAKNYLMGVDDPFLHQMMQDFANQQNNSLVSELQVLKNSLQRNVETAKIEPYENNDKENYFKGYIGNAENVIEILSGIIQNHKQ